MLGAWSHACLQNPGSISTINDSVGEGSFEEVGKIDNFNTGQEAQEFLTLK